MKKDAWVIKKEFWVALSMTNSSSTTRPSPKRGLKSSAEFMAMETLITIVLILEIKAKSGIPISI